MRSRWIAIVIVAAAACTGAQPRVQSAQRAEPALDGPQLLEVAEVLARNGDQVRAVQYLVAAQTRGAPDREVIARLLELDAADGQYRLAIEHAETYLQAHPADTQVRQCLASFHAAVGATSDAIREYDRVLAQRPELADPHYALATLLRDADIEHARMNAHYRAYIALAPRGRFVEEARAGLFQELP
jgi:DNA-binding SARP family transcriptional activator